MSEKEIAIDRIKQRMDDMSKEATENGMTPEILASILNEDMFVLDANMQVPYYPAIKTAVGKDSGGKC